MGTRDMGYGDMRFRIWGGRDLGTGGQEDVGQGHRGRGDGGNGNAGTWDLGHNGIWGQEIWDVGTGRNGDGGDAGRRHRPSPVLTPNPTTTAATEVPRPPLRTGTAAAVSPSVARDLFGHPPFHFRISGGGGAPRPGVPSGGWQRPLAPNRGVPTGVVALQEEGGPLCWGGVVPINGGGGSDSGFSVTPPPRPSPRFGSLQAEATAVSPRGGWGGGTPQNRAPIAQPKGTPLPPPPSAQRRVPAPPGGDNLGVGDIKAGGVTMW